MARLIRLWKPWGVLSQFTDPQGRPTLAGLVDVSVDYIAIDTIRVPRPVLLDIFTAWRDGYAEGIAENSELELDEVLASFEEMLNCLRLPEGYAVWQLPIVRGRVPDPSR